MLAALKFDGYNGFNLKNVSAKLRDDKEIVLLAIDRGSPYYRIPFKYASTRLRDDEEVVLRAMLRFTIDNDNEEHTFKYVSDRIKNNKKIILKILSKMKMMKNSFYCSVLYEKLSKTLQNDKEIALAVVSIVKSAIKLIPPSLQNDPDIIKASKRL